MSKSPTLYLMAGLPGSGKSTFARALAKSTKAPILESDKVRKALFSKPTYSGRESGEVFKTIMAGARECGAKGQSVIIDATNLSTRDRRPFYDLAKANDFHKFVTILVRTTPTVACERLRHKTVNNNSEATEEVYWRMAEKSMGEFPYGALVVNGEIDTEESLKEVLEAVKQWPLLRTAVTS